MELNKIREMTDVELNAELDKMKQELFQRNISLLQ